MSQHEAVRAIRERAPGFSPRIGLVLGSGLGGLAEAIADPTTIPFEEVPGFPVPTVSGHRGRLVLGHLGGVPVACMQGRMHVYEGHPAAAITVPVRALGALGCRILVLTNAAGSLRPEMGPGSLMAISDHINWAGFNPLIGANDDAVGERFPDMSNAYDRELRRRLHAAARAEETTLAEGVYLWCSGPSFETAAEIRAFRALGADAVGMSTVPECLAAVHAGIKVVAVSTITGLAVGLGAEPPSHAETLAQGEKAAGNLGRLISRFVAEALDD